MVRKKNITISILLDFFLFLLPLYKNSNNHNGNNNNNSNDNNNIAHSLCVFIASALVPTSHCFVGSQNSGCEARCGHR